MYKHKKQQENKVLHCNSVCFIDTLKEEKS